MSRKDAEVQKESIKRKFRIFDTNGDGTLSLGEMTSLLKEGDPSLTDRQLKLLFRGVDKDGSGHVDFDEFVEYLFSLEPPRIQPTGHEARWFVCASAGNADALLQLLKKAGSNSTLMNSRDPNPSAAFPCCAGFTAAMHAAAGGHDACLQFLAARSANLDAKDTKLGMTAVMLTTDAGRSDSLRVLVENGANIDAPDHSGSTALMLAVSAGQVDCVKYLVEQEVDLNAQDSAGWSAIMLAAQAGMVGCLRLLLAGRADVDARNSKGQTALMFAVMCRSEVCVRCLMKAKAKPMLKDRHGETAANVAQRMGIRSCLRMLQQRSSNLFSLALAGGAGTSTSNDSASKASEAWLDAAWLGRPDLLDSMAGEEGAEASSKGPDGWTAAMVASIAGYPRCLELLIRKGADVNEKDTDSFSAAMWAATKGHLECLRVLADHSADLDARDAKGNSAVSLAAEGGQSDIIRFLHERGADMGARRNDGSSVALLFLLTTGQKYKPAVLRPQTQEGTKESMVLGHDHPVNRREQPENYCDACGKHGTSYRCARGCDFDLCKLCWSKTKELVWDNQTPPRTAESRGSDLELINRASSPDRAAGQVRPPSSQDVGAPATKRPPTAEDAAAAAMEDSKSRQVRNSWFRAAQNGRVDVLEHLADQGADVDAASSRGMTAVMIAADQGHAEALSFLVSRDADMLAKDTLEGTAAVSFAARQGHFSIIKALVDEGGAYVDDQDYQGRTPLMEAAMNGSERCVRLLARRGADPNLLSEDNKSAAMMAAADGRKECLRVLAEHGAALIVPSDGTNVLHVFEGVAGFDEARSVVPAVDWLGAASGGAAGLREALRGSSEKSGNHIAGLHLCLWAYDDWDNLRVRKPELVEALFGCLVELLSASKDMSLDHVGKQALSLVLEAGLKRALSAEQSKQLSQLNTEVLSELEKALDDRQEKLKKVSKLTETVDVYFDRWDRHNKKVAGKLDQRDAMPEELWRWLEMLPEGCVERLDAVHLCFRKLNLVNSSATLANYLRDHALLNDSALYARAAAHVLTGYAAIVDPQFNNFMKDHFGNRFKPAPVKKLARIFNKLRGDHPGLADDGASAEDPQLRCSYFELGDAVRGSVEASGAEAMIQTIEQLQRLNKLSDHGRFDVWRIKNTHHEGADETTGGYRDVKVLGRFTARKKKGGEFPLPISMVVEVQVIDVVYLNIKKYMHKAYSIDRGDFG